MANCDEEGARKFRFSGLTFPRQTSQTSNRFRVKGVLYVELIAEVKTLFIDPRFKFPFSGGTGG
jgi:hypothetical protein